MANGTGELKILLVSRKAKIDPHTSKGQVKALKLYTRLHKLDTTIVANV
jgi:hypothetical protein